ncbi:hypothetical protein [Denitrobaculum tricleocarpae]|uniref:Uncharacterized protein n=1 Tax=Denitrobaculum tricleocarpae TaxID=2591009 RepID=A0A545TPC9_9PROT|nr:hypothetical protein [Denitrobaculum tricleocarpae]TQV79077.1 hypothetical protein FKG95_15490 [Denitrobaculum tricleocarpae]
MPRIHYSYGLRREVPLLTDEEWRPIGAHLSNYIRAIKDYRRAHGCSISEALEKNQQGQKALAAYEALTGVRLEHPEQIYALPLSLYGRPCPSCSKPFRTPRARMCADCGYQLPEGEVAGPLQEENQLT